MGRGEKPTPAQLRFLGEHTVTFFRQRSGAEEGYRPAYMVGRGGKSYDFVGRCADAGLVEIAPKGGLGWPYSWAGTWLTEKGWAALGLEAPEGYDPEESV